MCDAVNLIHLYCENLFDPHNIFVITNNNETTSVIKKKVNDKLARIVKCNIEYISSNNLIDDLSFAIKSINNNFILCLSSHGYANGDKNYITWNGIKVTDQQFHDILTNNIHPNLHCLSLIDTCQSGTMLNLNYQTKDLISYKPENLSNSILNIVCIGAVDDNEYDQDDISDFGYGGGLTSSFIDFIHGSTDLKTIKTFFSYYKNRISQLGHHPVLSVNNYK
jgi:hypothetical protein